MTKEQLKEMEESMGKEEFDRWILASRLLDENKISYEEYEIIVGQSIMVLSKSQGSGLDKILWTKILKRMWNCRGKQTTSIDKVKMEQIIRDELPSVTPEPQKGEEEK